MNVKQTHLPDWTKLVCFVFLFYISILRGKTKDCLFHWDSLRRFLFLPFFLHRNHFKASPFFSSLLERAITLETYTLCTICNIFLWTEKLFPYNFTIEIEIERRISSSREKIRKKKPTTTWQESFPFIFRQSQVLQLNVIQIFRSFRLYSGFYL